MQLLRNQHPRQVVGQPGDFRFHQPASKILEWKAPPSRGKLARSRVPSTVPSTRNPRFLQIKGPFVEKKGPGSY